MTPGPARPPRPIEALLRLLLPVGIVGDSIVGDAREEYAEYVRGGGWLPGIWYTLHATRLATGYVIRTGRMWRWERF